MSPPPLQVTLHGITCGPSAVEAWLASRPQLLGVSAPAAAQLGGLVAEVTAPSDALRRASIGLPSNSATPEANAIRLRREGLELSWGTPSTVDCVMTALKLFERWGGDSVALLRADPSLLPELQIGGWFLASLRARLLRRLLLHLHRVQLAPRSLSAPLGGLALRVAADAAFWCGVRGAAGREEWRRLTVGYSVLLYHRLAGSNQPGQERVDVAPERFARDVRLLRGLGLRPIELERLLGFHADGGLPLLDRRRFVITVDDAFRDCVAPLARAASAAQPQLFVPTGLVGGAASWLDGVALADWDELGRLAASGIALGGHGSTHARLTELDDEEIAREVRQSHADLCVQTGRAPSAFAYPYGAHNERVRRAVSAAGFRIAYTTAPGLNGAGSDPYRLRRVSVKCWDSRAAIVWKAVTGEALPYWWERGLQRRYRAGLRLDQGGRLVASVLQALFPPSAARPRRRGR